MNYPAVIKVLAKPDYRLELEFSNGEVGILDMKPYLSFGIFTRLCDPHQFKQVKISFDTIEWNCGPDLDPEFVYSNCQKVVVT